MEMMRDVSGYRNMREFEQRNLVNEYAVARNNKTLRNLWNNNIEALMQKNNDLIAGRLKWEEIAKPINDYDLLESKPAKEESRKSRHPGRSVQR